MAKYFMGGKELTEKQLLTLDNYKWKPLSFKQKVQLMRFWRNRVQVVGKHRELEHPTRPVIKSPGASYDKLVRGQVTAEAYYRKAWGSEWFYDLSTTLFWESLHSFRYDWTTLTVWHLNIYEGHGKDYVADLLGIKTYYSNQYIKYINTMVQKTADTMLQEDRKGQEAVV